MIALGNSVKLCAPKDAGKINVACSIIDRKLKYVFKKGTTYTVLTSPRSLSTDSQKFPHSSRRQRMTSCSQSNEEKVFVDTNADVRLARRLRRDISQRGRDLEGVLKQCHFGEALLLLLYCTFNDQCRHCVPCGGDNEVAVKLIVKHVHTQVKGWHTFMRNKSIHRDEFIFYSKKLICLLIEYALALLFFKELTVETSERVLYSGKQSSTTEICGVLIVSAGETMEQVVRDICEDIRIGKNLILTNQESVVPELYYISVYLKTKDYRVSTFNGCNSVATGAVAMMAIRVLLDHDVAEENIIY